MKGLFAEAHKAKLEWCYINQRPKAVVEYANNPVTESLVNLSIQKWYAELRAKHSCLAGVFVGD